MQTHMKVAGIFQNMANLFSELDKCRVPNTENEYFDCCFTMSHSSCELFGTLNSALLAINGIIFIVLICRSSWFRQNRLLMAAYAFQFAVIACRVVYLFHSGHQGSFKLGYMLFKTGGPGITVLSLVAFLLYMN